jgi:DNA-3-methyladenine glycosylase
MPAPPALPELAELLAGPALEVAPRLLGATVSHAGVSVRLTEVEAYAGADDPGSHAFRGRTPRNEAMFGAPAHLYVYFTYGMHHCANLVCGPSGTAQAVLLRAGEVVSGVEVARQRRGSVADRDLARGPARLCQALDLSLPQNGATLTTVEQLGSVSVRLAAAVDGASVRTGPRVGLRAAGERPWRFWLDGDAHVSAYRPAAPLRRRQAPDPPPTRPVERH